MRTPLRARFHSTGATRRTTDQQTADMRGIGNGTKTQQGYHARQTQHSHDQLNTTTPLAGQCTFGASH